MWHAGWRKTREQFTGEGVEKNRKVKRKNERSEKWAGPEIEGNEMDAAGNMGLLADSTENDVVKMKGIVGIFVIRWLLRGEWGEAGKLGVTV